MEFSLIETVERLTTSEGINYTPIPYLRLFRADSISQPLHTVYEPSLFIILQGSKSVLVGNQTYVYDRNSYLISSVRLPVSGQILDASPEKPFLSLQIVFDPLHICSMVEKVTLPKQTPNPNTTLAIASQTMDEELSEVIIRLGKLLQKPYEIDVLAPLYQQEILYRLLQSENLNSLRQFAVPESNAARLSKIIPKLHNDLSEPLSIRQLADEAKMSVASFHKHFKSLTAMSPMQYRKSSRLQEAKRLMLLEGMEASEAAFQVGYESPSQFSREYARYFGLPPSKDIKQRQESLS
ncbi:MAG: AraC family transcriptional regulator [Sulfuricurvum sp.]